MTGVSAWALATTAAYITIQIALVVRILLRKNREPASRIAWIVVVFSLPIMGIVAYALFGEVNIGRRAIQRTRVVLASLPDHSADPDQASISEMPQPIAQLFRVGKSISGFRPVGGNRARLMPDSNASIDAMVADIDAATDHVHLLFYIWLPDNNGLKVAEALKRAAARGVACRAIADDLGSRIMIRSEHWRAMRDSGVHLARALPIGNPLARILKGRIDLRNHRKIVVIDNRITYCGSQNCADPEFRIKAKFAPWVDAMLRFEGPIAQQNQQVFVGDWMVHVDEDLRGLLHQPIGDATEGFIAQVIATGPTMRHSAMPEMFETLMYKATDNIVISTPYYIPNEAMQAALCACARRGVDTRIILPAVNDSWVVGAASRSYYEEMLASGVRIFEYLDGLLHAKTLTVDGDVTLIGSANMDRRSFELNYENNILLYDRGITAEVRQRQQEYISNARPVVVETVAKWDLRTRLRNNAVAMIGPIL